MTEEIVQKSLEKFNRDKTRLMDILLAIQGELEYIPQEVISLIAMK